MHFLGEHHIFIFLLQLFVLLICARGLGEVFRRWKQPALTAELLVGIVLGPTILGRFLPAFQAALFPPDAIQQAMLETVAWLGVLFLLLDTGLEIDFSIAWRQRGSALAIALADIAVPMVVAFVPVMFLPDHFLAHVDRRLSASSPKFPSPSVPCSSFSPAPSASPSSCSPSHARSPPGSSMP